MTDPTRGDHAAPSEARGPEIAHVLFMDLVGYSKLTTDKQGEIVPELQDVVRGTDEFRRAQATGQLIGLPTGDGMALVFFTDFEAPLRCATQIVRAMPQHPALVLRMGLHSGPVYRVHDINTHGNVAGGGVNIAQRVMDCGDAGHILLSKTFAEFIGQLSPWAGALHDLGEHPIKHGDRVHIFNFIAGEVGNPEWPGKLHRPTTSSPPPVSGPRVEAGAIVMQGLAVLHRRDDRGGEALSYEPTTQSPWDPSDVVEGTSKPVRSAVLKRQIGALRARIENLTERARVGQKRLGTGIEKEAAAVAEHVLPPQGFAGLLGPGVHPRFDIAPDIAAQIPWEALEETYLWCEQCRKATPTTARTAEAGDGPRYCEQCGRPLERAGGKLALTHHLSYLVRGKAAPGAEGREFLVVEDPTGDLTQDEHDPDGVCRAHLVEVRRRLEELGYTIRPLGPGHATRARVLSALKEPTVVGVYFFGHGIHPRDGDEGCLILAGGPLYAGEILNTEPRARFVFLNACDAGAAPQEWDLERGHLSVASAFGRGSASRVVIAPLWPVINVHAARFALDVFRHGSLTVPSGEAMRVARQRSLERYAADEPDLAWLSYRYFGDPNRPLPAPPSVAAPEPAPSPTGSPALPTPAATPVRVFDRDGQLDVDVFAFAVDDVLLRAGKRRNLQERERVSTGDLIAGLLRKGDLTRLALARLGRDADELYAAVGAANEADGGQAVRTPDGSAGVPRAGDVPRGGRALGELLRKWVVRARQAFSPAAAEILEAADRGAREREARRGDPRVAERDLLDALLAEGAWTALGMCGLPPAPDVRRVLDDLARAGEVDDNGHIALSALDDDARKVVEAAHALAQQRGVSPITRRLMFAAFLDNRHGYAASRCRAAHIDPERLFQLMIMATEAETGTSPSPRSFGLSPEACGRIVAPMIQAAQRHAAAGRPIGEPELFAGFGEKLDASFKQAVRELDPAIDLHKLWPPPLDESAQRVIRAAHQLAQEHGAFPIGHRMVLAAFLDEPGGPVFRRLDRRIRGGAQTLRERLLRSAAGGGGARSFSLDAAATARAVSPMVERATALSQGSPIDAPLLFRAFCELAPSALRRSLAAWGVDLQALGGASASDDTPGAHGVSTAVPDDRFEPGVRLIVTEAARLARLQGWPEVRTPHLFAAMIERVGPAGPWSGRLDPDQLRTAVLSLLPPSRPGSAVPPVTVLSANASAVIRRAFAHARARGRGRIDEADLVAAFFEDGGGVVGELLRRANVPLPPGSGQEVSEAADAGYSSMLDEYGVDLTRKALQGHVGEIVGRDDEVEAVMQTLLLTENANPLLVGEAGVGKTAIVEGLARRIAAGTCPERLRGLRVVEMATGALVANTRLRGDFEQRVQRLLAAARGKVVLFIDEIHTLVGAGTGEGGLDAGNMLKAALARGDLRLVGATTIAEYKRTIAKDRALARRFQVQMIAAPSREATIAMLVARKPALEGHHGVRVTEAAIVAAVDLSGRYVLDRQWPAKARDVLERACVIAGTAAVPAGGEAAVTEAHVARVVSQMANLPVERVSVSERALLADLPARLGAHLVGQDEAITLVAEAIRRGRQGLSDTRRPWGVFLFVGPSGVGKTELAKVLAEEVYGPEGLIRFDMGEFTEPHADAKLLGAPPGFVGYERGAPLVERIRARPYSLLLFDEIEHAHDNVLAVLLRLASEGTLQDGEGFMADARSSIVILTSNLLHDASTISRIGFGQRGEARVDPVALRLALERRLPRKLLDRVDAIVPFHPLSLDDLETLASRRAGELAERATRALGLTVVVHPAAAGWLTRRAAEPGSARAVLHAVDEQVGRAITAVGPTSGATGLEVRVQASGEGLEGVVSRGSDGSASAAVNRGETQDRQTEAQSEA